MKVLKYLRSKLGKPEISSSISDGLKILAKFLGISSWNPWRNESIYFLMDSYMRKYPIFSKYSILFSSVTLIF